MLLNLYPSKTGDSSHAKEGIMTGLHQTDKMANQVKKAKQQLFADFLATSSFSTVAVVFRFCKGWGS